MTDLTRVDSARFALVTSIVLIVLNLGISWGGVAGYQTGARVYFAAALVGIGLALTRRESDPKLAGKAVSAALVSLLILFGLAVRDIPHVPLVVMIATIVLLLSVRFRAESA